MHLNKKYVNLFLKSVCKEKHTSTGIVNFK